ncbi:GNAT family N-acetyltransferase [Ammoniphilus resinae]|uniref:Ribosomal protein S18 acetylase RimI-like enzyme n=1 Tax=Ammoniphilus resinae TaxID=861532 RepID=A0ABS4GSH5_9BACL|nr:N-acetyltransferase [Ammoniphilus resinae]MBP1933209.1 ribosomal protein S18 acetylase RimI-like enzyme [Ammoniphilus resinae]
MVNIRNVEWTDLPRLVAIEHQCFPKEEAATKTAFEERIQRIADSFFVAVVDNQVVGLVNGPVISQPFITDDLFSDIKDNPPTGGHQSILGIAVAPLFQNRGIASALLAHLERSAKEKQRDTVTLTCKEELVYFYERKGYQNRGVSNSQHGGVTWYNMTKSL